MNLSQSELKSLSKLLPDGGLDDFAAAIESPTYTESVIQGRPLQVPNSKLAQAHSVFNAIARLYLPPPVGVHAIVETVENSIPAYSSVLRSDIQKCFLSLKRAPALNAVDDWLSSIGASPAGKNFLRKAAASLFLGDSGLATGSPASPALLDIVFSQIDLQHKDSRTWRYVDDLLALSTSEEAGNKVLQHWKEALTPFGWAISDHKTFITPSDQYFQFLGRSFNQGVANTVPFLLKPASIAPLQYYPNDLKLDFNPSADSYRKTKTQIIFSSRQIPNHLEKGSIDAIILLWGLSIQNPNIAPNINALLFKDIFAHLHSSLWKIYLKSVKTPREKGKPVNAAEAERILLALAIACFWGIKGKFPLSFSHLESSLPQILLSHPKKLKAKNSLSCALSMAASGDGAYHELIKLLFKLEWQIRNGDCNSLPESSPLMEQMSQDNACSVDPLTTPIFED